MIVNRAADVLRRGGIIAYPTEGVFGLGCLPADHAALLRLLTLKNRDADKGVILIAADTAQLSGWIDLPEGSELPRPVAGAPVTWLVPAAPGVSSLVLGQHTEIAVRLTNHPIARAICNAVQSPLVSTSANISGRPVARNRYVLRRQFGDLVDYLVPGICGPASGPSQIQNFTTGVVLRPRGR